MSLTRPDHNGQKSSLEAYTPASSSATSPPIEPLGTLPRDIASPFISAASSITPQTLHSKANAYPVLAVPPFSRRPSHHRQHFHTHQILWFPRLLREHANATDISLASHFVACDRFAIVLCRYRSPCVAKIRPVPSEPVWRQQKERSSSDVFSYTDVRFLASATGRSNSRAAASAASSALDPVVMAAESAITTAVFSSDTSNRGYHPHQQPHHQERQQKPRQKQLHLALPALFS